MSSTLAAVAQKILMKKTPLDAATLGHDQPPATTEKKQQTKTTSVSRRHVTELRFYVYIILYHKYFEHHR